MLREKLRKPSIRTRVSFEKGIKMLGGDTILFPPEALEKKEDIRDVIGYLDNWADMVIVRHKDLPLIEYMAEHPPLINYYGISSDLWYDVYRKYS